VRLPHLAHTTEMENEFLSADEAAVMLRMHPRTIRRLLSSAELPGARLGRQWRVSVAALEAYIESGNQKPVAASGKVHNEKAKTRKATH
jgi:excisionase family DNA binding protein